MKVRKLDIISIESFIFELQGIGWDLSMIRISYKLMKVTKKTTKMRKILKTTNPKNDKTICFELTAWNIIIHSILN